MINDKLLTRKMTIVVFLIDTSASMLQRTYLGTTYLDYARLAVEQFIKQRQRDPASSGDRYMLMTFEEYPHSIKSGWKENQRIFNDQLKNLKAKGSLNFESSLESVLRLLMVSRMQSGTGAAIETYGYGRYPSYAEHVVIIPIIDGSSLPDYNIDSKVPKPHLLTGIDLTVEGFRWDQRLYPIVLRLPGHLQPPDQMQQQQQIPPPEDQSIAQSFAEQMGGRSFAIQLHRSLGPSIDQIMQRIQTNGVFIRFQKHGPDPAPSIAQQNEQQKTDENNELPWRDSLVLIKGKADQKHSHWPIPEAYWPDSVKKTLPPRTAHPIITFKCDRVEPLFNTDFPLDKYELDSGSPFAQYILNRKESNLCWQIFIENSYKQPGLGLPFGYIKISTSSTVTLYIMPYNYPNLLSLLAMAKDSKMANSVQFQHNFERYLNTVPGYYYSILKKSLARLKVMPPSLEEASTKLYGYCNLSALMARIKHQGQQEFESACTVVYKFLREQDVQPVNPALLVKITRSRKQLGKEALTECSFRSAVSAYKANIPVDNPALKDLSIILLETAPQAVAPSQQFKNPFDIARTNLCTQLDKMRMNYDQQIQINNLHVLEGGLPGQKIKLQHAEDLHNLPINKMGIYEEYMKSLNAIGLGPKRELEPQAARPHAFGNPFKLDKKNMSIVDEVGEVNAGAGTSSGNSQPDNPTNSASERKERRKERASSEGPAGSTPIRHKRKQGPIDVNRLASWKRRRRASSIRSGDTDSSADFAEVQSAPDELGELRMAELDEEEQEEEEEEAEEQPDDEQMEAESAQTEPFPDLQMDNDEQREEVQQEILQLANQHISTHYEEPSSTNWENNFQKMNQFGQNERFRQNANAPAGTFLASSPGDGFSLPDLDPSTSMPTSIDVNGSIGGNDGRKKRNRPRISPQELSEKKHQICQLIRQFGTSTDEQHTQLMQIVMEGPISQERRQLLELGKREAEEFKRPKLVALIEKELQRTNNKPNKHFQHQSLLRQNGFNS